MLKKDTEYTIITTIISKKQKKSLQEIATERKISKSKLLRFIISNYLQEF